ncbi:MAG: hypothetical protein DMG17_23175 [Acidobacteria bacterium]|nr:MAG: hypothetical protein AUH28_10770 [Acidobacteria bacterium 13_1_40CM_56_16]OLD17902.1 MAG: hypothetical protein AUI91_11610 [Acidobacteria bacterium 13_1_40CM_3_56_11]OLD67522.1 MAG: hypothetical protein AUI45_13445 [Acidobacteria bacterium 13_1_40CM_2_56_11]PYR71377.1 MAG: hypothetical protein DMG20_03250 [Acidobacteriota bacterium]PYS11158.1 MAG: hypothetical protein DMG17_23175 [Acidobacteriota bacterium]
MDSDNGLTGVRIVVTGWLETTLEERGHIILAIVLDIIGKLTQGPGSFHLELGALETPQEAFHLQFQSGKCGGSRR